MDATLLKGLDRRQLAALERMQAREMVQHSLDETVLPIVASPVMQLIFAVVITEYLQKKVVDWGPNAPKRYDTIIGNGFFNAGQIIEGGAVLVAGLQALSPYLARLSESSGAGGTAGTSIVSTMVPLLTAAAAAALPGPP